MKVSVVTGYYNRGALLERTILSILSQTYVDFELIVFDDASPDGSAETLRELSRRLNDPRLRVRIHDRNRGFARGLAEAIAESTGEYIAIQGSGDISLPRRLERQVAVLDADPKVGVVGGWYENVVEGGSSRRLRKPDVTGLNLEGLLAGNVFSHGEVMFRRSVYDQVGGYRTAFAFAQDYDLWLRAIQVSSFAVVPEVVYERMVQFDGISYQPRKLVLQSRYSLIARRLVALTPQQEAAALRVLETNGPTALVKDNDPQLQKKLTVGAIRATIFGSPDDGYEVAIVGLTGRVRRGLVILFTRTYWRPFAAPIRALARRVLNIQPE